MKCMRQHTFKRTLFFETSRRFRTSILSTFPSQESWLLLATSSVFHCATAWLTFQEILYALWSPTDFAVPEHLQFNRKPIEYLAPPLACYTQGSAV